MKKFLLTIIPEKHIQTLISIVKKAKISGATYFHGRGTAPNLFLQKIGVGTIKKSIVFSVVQEKDVASITKELTFLAEKEHDCTGIVFTLAMEKKNMATKTGFTVIVIIVNSGYGEQVMATARKAGAPGGTIINAKGTGKQEDMNFFGLTIMPEKEMLLIVSNDEITPKITEAVQSLACVKNVGSGIVFTMPAQDYFHLGALCPHE